MMQWLLDTLLWTAALIAFVLLVRRPVARWFGPQVAYALWLLPAIRLILPTVTLPHWLAPQEAAPVGEGTVIILDQGSDAAVATQVDSEILLEPGLAATGPLIPIDLSSILLAVPWVEVGCAVWLIGAAVFLWHRFASYFELRTDLLSGGKEMGRAGRIRLVETPGTKAPLAFGVIDPVIALPEGFMALDDREARDLALAHELAHHRAGDLLINIIVQPLFALHWFNPLSRYGWLAMRRDQEAACDARVVAKEPEEARAMYANLIASTAVGPNVALAAPMACPVLGDKSIIHRLRSLNMSDTSSSRRMAGRLMIGAAVLALPLTASVTYAESNAPEPPAPPPVSVEPPAAPLPPAPPVGAPPAPPAPPAVPAVASQTIVVVDPDTEVEKAEKVEKTKTVKVISRDKDTQKRRSEYTVRRIHAVNRDHDFDSEELEETLAELRAELAEADEEIKEAIKEAEIAMVEMNHRDSEKGRTIIKMQCRGKSGEVATFVDGKGGANKIYLCEADIMAHALKGLKEARSAIADNPEITGEMRRNLLKELDRQIKDWKRRGREG
ncbi:M56 family metallopeptidase [Erythrobacter rubeus]|uniref:Peptidase M56 domain-containing protein n=1 Tax=Erythrobacter rubeus TaxID=2760803 RepID=A0ABR8KT60_9SPHN|nr:M56 family metallopeptidase [Erythrobacter rubeus]MBD2841624.1 hypothetical protein [Erythrobacter rubeus]